MSGDPQLRRKLEHHLDELPVLPTAVAKLMMLRPEDESYAEEVIKVLESEPNFSTRLVSAANSAASAPVTPITTLNAAIARMGSRNASNLILSLAVTKVFVPRDPWEKSLWRHAIQVAVAARNLSLHCAGVSFHRDEAYACGLLHDLGRFVMFQEAPEQLRRVDEGEWSSGEELLASERSICGLTHTELGALACTKWHMPDLVCHVVRDHHSRVSGSTDPKVVKLTALIHFADLAMFPSAMPGTPGWEDADEQSFEHGLRAKMPAFIHLGSAELRELLRTTAAMAGELTHELGVA